MLNRRYLAPTVALALATACERAPTSPETANAPSDVPQTMAVTLPNQIGIRADLGGASSVADALGLINDDLAARGLSIRVAKAEFVSGGPTATEVGQTVVANDRELRLDTRWVPGDTRRRLDAGDEVTQVTFGPLSVANGFIDGLPPIDASFDTWNDVQCSKLPIEGMAPVSDVFPSALLTFGSLPSDPLFADISTIGFVPGFLFDAFLGAGASSNVLGVTFTFFWIDVATGIPTDVNGDGRDDTALKEVWYNDDFAWSTDGTPGTIDIETAALHENGHALELGHYGRISVGNKNGKLHVSPRAVMNAVILGVLRSPRGTDNGALCGNFASWPN